jgi:hypothetical protein
MLDTSPAVKRPERSHTSRLPVGLMLLLLTLGELTSAEAAEQEEGLMPTAP